MLTVGDGDGIVAAGQTRDRCGGFVVAPQVCKVAAATGGRNGSSTGSSFKAQHVHYGGDQRRYRRALRYGCHGGACAAVGSIGHNNTVIAHSICLKFRHVIRGDGAVVGQSPHERHGRRRIGGRRRNGYSGIVAVQVSRNSQRSTRRCIVEGYDGHCRAGASIGAGNDKVVGAGRSYYGARDVGRIAVRACPGKYRVAGR